MSRGQLQNLDNTIPITTKIALGARSEAYTPRNLFCARHEERSLDNTGRETSNNAQIQLRGVYKQLGERGATTRKFNCDGYKQVNSQQRHNHDTLTSTHDSSITPPEKDCYNNIAVYGGGGFGTALACHLTRCYANFRRVTLFIRNEKTIKEIIEHRTNSKYLDDIILPDNIIPTNDLTDLLDKEVIIIAVPSYAFHDALINLKNCGIGRNVVLIIATKGFGRNPTDLLSDKIKAILPENPVAFISGPHLAKEIAKNLLTSATVASSDINIARRLMKNLSAPQFKINLITEDIVTIQVAGAVKNIFAIESGWCDAKNYGENAKATLIVAGLLEIKKLSEALSKGKISDSILSSSGVVGDLILTCYSKQSRNNRFGYQLAVEKNIGKFLNKKNKDLLLVEGVESAKLVLDFIKTYNLSLPIIESIASKLF